MGASASWLCEVCSAWEKGGGRTLLGLRLPFLGEGPRQKAEIQTKTRLPGERLNPAPTRCRSSEKSQCELGIRCSSEPAVRLLQWGHNSPGGRAAGVRPLPDHAICWWLGEWAGLWALGVGWLSTPCNLRWGEGLGYTYPFQGSRTVSGWNYSIPRLPKRRLQPAHRPTLEPLAHLVQMKPRGRCLLSTTQNVLVAYVIWLPGQGGPEEWARWWVTRQMPSHSPPQASPVWSQRTSQEEGVSPEQ